VDTPGVHREIEHKLAVPARFRLPDLSGSAATVDTIRRMPTLRLTAVYYDTTDLRLARSHITLRRRTGGNDDGWHLKLPVSESRAQKGATSSTVRDELQLPITRETSPPAQLVEMVLGVTRGAALHPVATLRNERRPIELFDSTGDVVAEVTDDRVTVLRRGTVTDRFRELEVEAGPGRTGIELLPIVDALLAAGAKESTFASKAARALGDGAAAPPDIAPLPTPTEHDTAGDVLRAHLALHAARLVREDLNVRRGLPDGVHQMRVAARQLRSALRTFAPLLDTGDARWLRDELGWLAGELGAARDTEVLEQRLCDDVAGLPAPAADVDSARDLIESTFDEAAALAADRANVALTSRRYLALLDRLVAAVAEPPFAGRGAQRPASRVLPPMVQRSWRRLARDAEALRKKGPDDPWHETRIHAKRARYALDVLAPAFGTPARRLAKQITRITEVLGTHQDASIAADAATALADSPDLDPAVRRVFELLHDSQRAQVKAARAEFFTIWPDVARPRRRKWLEQ